MSGRGAGGPRCPICAKPRDPSYRPFCSPGCRDRDLLNWLEGRYAVPVEEEPDPDDEPPFTPEGPKSRSRSR